jgi:hypothetical protein
MRELHLIQIEPRRAPRLSPSAVGAVIHHAAIFARIVLLVTQTAISAVVHAGDAPRKAPKVIAPAVSTGTGLLLEPALTLPDFTRERFVAAMNTVGPEKIHRPWTSAVVALPPHPRDGAKGLTHDEVKAYMVEVKRLFETANAMPVSDVGLISTQEDVVRKPMLNHVAAFANETVRAYLLVQRTPSDPKWSYFSIVQDLTLDPVLDYFAELKPDGPKFEGTSCYKCHSSGPLAIHPAREDLVLDAPLAAAVSAHIAEQPRSIFYFPVDSPKPPTGEKLTLKFCARCHEDDGDRAPLFQLQSHAIRVLVDFGYMPPKRRLKPEELAQLKAWLEHKL